MVLLCTIRKIRICQNLNICWICGAASHLSSCHCNTAVTLYWPAFQLTQLMLPIHNTAFKVVGLLFFHTIQLSVITNVMSSQNTFHPTELGLLTGLEIVNRNGSISLGHQWHINASLLEHIFVYYNMIFIYYDRTVSRLEAKGERQWDGIRKGLRAGTRTWDVLHRHCQHTAHEGVSANIKDRDIRTWCSSLTWMSNVLLIFIDFCL